MILLRSVACLLLILGPFVLTAAWLHVSSGRDRSWRRGWLMAATAWGAWLVVVTELLSLVSALQVGPVVAAWAGSSAVTGLALYRARRHARGTPADSTPWPRHRVWPLLPSAGVVAATVGLVAVASAPNNNDSLTYHLPRVLYWLQEERVHFYATVVERQLYQPPAAEYILAHLHILSGTDRLDALPQWFSMLTAAVAASLIASVLGAGTRGQLYSSIAALTIPMGILQGSSTQNDYVLGAWISILTWGALDIAKQQRLTVHDGLLLGGALGLALLTKGTGYLFSFAPLVWLLVWSVHRKFLRPAPVAAALLVALLLNLGHYLRTYDLYETPLTSGSERYSNERHDPAALTSNILRNAGLHLAIPLPQANQLVEDGIEAAHAVLGIDAENPKTTWPGVEWDVGLSLHEDRAPNPLHLVLTIFALGAAFAPSRIRNWRTVSYGIILLATFVTFSAYLKWQPWNSRLHLPMFVLAAPLIGTLLGSWPRRYAIPTVGLLLIGALPWLLANESRPLIGPSSVLTTSAKYEYLANGWREQRDEYEAVAAAVEDAAPERVGLILPKDNVEYLLWQFGDLSRYEVRHLNVSNLSASLAEQDFKPNIVICQECSARALGPYASWRGTDFGYTEVLRPDQPLKSR